MSFIPDCPSKCTSAADTDNDKVHRDATALAALRGAAAVGSTDLAQRQLGNSWRGSPLAINPSPAWSQNRAENRPQSLLNPDRPVFKAILTTILTMPIDMTNALAAGALLKAYISNHKGRQRQQWRSSKLHRDTVTTIDEGKNVADMGQLPQEIIDAIIDQFATSDEGQLRRGNEPREAKALKACALTARAFRSRSQQHLFASISCFTSNSGKLGPLVSGSPHLASYVTYFIVVLHADRSTGVVDFTVVSQTLALLENLVYLQVYSIHKGPAAGMWPAIFKNAFHEALLLPALRSLSLVRCTFADVLELESLLSHATGLKALTLEAVEFDNTNARRADPVSHEPRIILDSLEVTLDNRLADDAVDAMLSSFTTLDIKHLRSLDVQMWTPLIPLLKANARTVQKVRYYLPDPEDSDPHILENNTSLRHIEITQGNTDMVNSLRVFGDLGHLMALRTVSLRFQDHFSSFNDVMAKELWADLDKVLAQARDTLEDVQIHMPITKRWHISVPASLALLRGWLPSVAGKISLQLEAGYEDD
ncbi:hypothetical protein C8J57DRAFT_1537265 [Mycena rebaudengoi]|nr:hypothetical protein C8J57DRAFT_1537265 [Mycena rebaudengoi]